MYYHISPTLKPKSSSQLTETVLGTITKDLFQIMHFFKRSP